MTRTDQMGGTALTQTRGYLLQRDLLDHIETQAGSSTVARYDYTYDDLGRRTFIEQTGSVFSRYGGKLETTLGYNERNELTGSVTSSGTTNLPGRAFGYKFDPIGNRTAVGFSDDTTSTPFEYERDELNRYLERDHPGFIAVTGLASASAAVTVTGAASVDRVGQYYYAQAAKANTTQAANQTITVEAGLSSPSRSAQEQRELVTKPTKEVFDYDEDGNLTQDYRWDYVYDTENRLVEMTTRIDAGIAPYVLRERLRFEYDYLGRRISKSVEYCRGENWVLRERRLFVYEGWTMIAELNGAGNTLRSFTWGLDLSNTAQGAGGIGGLLGVTEHATSESYLTVIDGSGNVSAMVAAATGQVVAEYEYDPFGNVLRATGEYARTNRFGFSTKYTDLETGLVDFGLRYYSPDMGRFINRDPIGEQGGLNLYAFVGNRAFNALDFLGLEPDDNLEERRGMAGFFARLYNRPGGAEMRAAYDREKAAQTAWAERRAQEGQSTALNLPQIGESAAAGRNSTIADVKEGPLHDYVIEYGPIQYIASGTYDEEADTESPAKPAPVQSRIRSARSGDDVGERLSLREIEDIFGSPSRVRSSGRPFSGTGIYSVSTINPTADSIILAAVTAPLLIEATFAAGIPALARGGVHGASQAAFRSHQLAVDSSLYYLSTSFHWVYANPRAAILGGLAALEMMDFVMNYQAGKEGSAPGLTFTRTGAGASAGYTVGSLNRRSSR